MSKRSRKAVRSPRFSSNDPASRILEVLDKKTWGPDVKIKFIESLVREMAHRLVVETFNEVMKRV